MKADDPLAIFASQKIETVLGFLAWPPGRAALCGYLKSLSDQENPEDCNTHPGDVAETGRSTHGGNSDIEYGHAYPMAYPTPREHLHLLLIAYRGRFSPGGPDGLRHGLAVRVHALLSLMENAGE